MIISMRNADWLRNGLIDLISNVKNDSIKMIEVGSYAGESADIFASQEKVKGIWCIDPWLSGYDDGDEASHTDFNEVEAAFDKVMTKHSSKIHKFKGTLQQFCDVHKDDIVPDLVYIDANHTYEGCRTDIETALNAWKHPYYMAGHDYANWCPGVMQAVDEKFGVPTMRFSDSSWMVYLNRR